MQDRSKLAVAKSMTADLGARLVLMLGDQVVVGRGIVSCGASVLLAHEGQEATARMLRDAADQIEKSGEIVI